jgi:hypothetical protein
MGNGSRLENDSDSEFVRLGSTFENDSGFVRLCSMFENRSGFVIVRLVSLFSPVSLLCGAKRTVSFKLAVAVCGTVSLTEAVLFEATVSLDCDSVVGSEMGHKFSVQRYPVLSILQ